jgi:hypothetical protein
MSQQNPDKLRDIAQAVRETIDRGQRIRELEDNLRNHLATVAALLLGLSPLGFQADRSEWDWALLAAMVAFAAAIVISTLHAYKLPGRLKKLDGVKCQETITHINNCNSNWKRAYNRNTALAVGVGLGFLIAFAVHGLELI